jgi:D-alanine-D-alanine ligase
LPLPARYIIKSAWEHASIGMADDAIVTAAGVGDLEREICVRGSQLGGEAFAEVYIDGREFNLALLAGADGAEVLPFAEIHFVDYPDGKPKVVGYAAKWESESFEFSHTPRCFDFPAADASLLDELRRIALRCWDVFDLHGHARVDFRVDESGRPWVLEVNTNPCLSPDAGFAAAADRAGLRLIDVVERVVMDARRRFGLSDGA